jgi:hypothetical protein
LAPTGVLTVDNSGKQKFTFFGHFALVLVFVPCRLPWWRVPRPADDRMHDYGLVPYRLPWPRVPTIAVKPVTRTCCQNTRTCLSKQRSSYLIPKPVVAVRADLHVYGLVPYRLPWRRVPTIAVKPVTRTCCQNTRTCYQNTRTCYQNNAFLTNRISNRYGRTDRTVSGFVPYRWPWRRVPTIAVKPDTRTCCQNTLDILE